MGKAKLCLNVLVWLAVLVPWAAVCQADDTLGDTTLEPVTNAWTALYATGNIWTYGGSVGFVGQGIYVYLENLASPFNADVAVYQTSGGLPSARLAYSALLPVSAAQ